MKLLVLGGTEFVGHAVVEAAVARGWEVSVFNRGRHPAPDGVARLVGDREGDLAALAEGRWDAVVDTWSAKPDAVRTATRLLKGRVGAYAYVSTVSVYVYPAPLGADEDAPVVDGEGDDYSAVKRASELAVLDAFGDRGLLVRPGLILGPHENIGRLPWWLNRIARGGDVLAPGPRDNPLQFVDARDLAAFTLDGLAAGLAGPYNVVSEPGHTTMGELLAECVRVTGSPARLRWAEPAVIEAAGIAPWTELPVWVPPGKEHDGIHGVDVGKALRAGLRCRPAAETVADTWAWLRSIGGEAPRRADRPSPGLDPEVEREVLAGLTG
ncbi:NAD-dependent epimerase/dehydratase family protein [Streptomyces sp. NBC_01190]|uniref:NAD-dependent epimerase/dehydratase family protein n=1 Tax=Streptomyces sp. NBC_01190 TaxID=2903767 RepID=UPI003867139C|nr:NAD-dependent epimerase/dehydratase family protein [Streptomyces sp. NBC_01190]